MSGNLVESLQRDYFEAVNQINELSETDSDESQQTKMQYQEHVQRLRTLGGNTNQAKQYGQP